MDPLSDVLSLLKPRTYVTGGLRAGGEWSIGLPSYEGIKCYAVVAGECWLSVEGVEQPARLGAGDCLLLPHGRPFVLASDLALPTVDARTILSVVGRRYNGVLPINTGKDFFLLGSHFSLEGDANFLLDVLPPVVKLEDDGSRESIRWAVERMLREMRDFQPGGTLVAQQVAYTLLVEALRLHVSAGAQHASNGSPKRTGWLFALADTRIRTALSGMHEAPAHHWTLEELAHSAGMSRTAFAQTFRKTVGEPPMAYLTRWRMTLAANRLRDRREPISSVAPSLGYQSESAFSAAFKRQWGSSPRQYLRARGPQLSASVNEQ
jgi:AraC-like DNA-binding protein